MGQTVKERKGPFRESGDNKGLACPFKAIVCEVGRCRHCQIYRDWQKLGEIVIICLWCSKVMDRKLGSGRPEVFHEICPECMHKADWLGG